MSDDPAPPTEAPQAEARCEVCGKICAEGERVRIELLRPALVELLEEERPGYDPKGFICAADLSRLRARYVARLIEGERGEISRLEKAVIKSLAENDIVAQDVDRAFSGQLTLGQRLSDGLASFGGSWGFISAFALFLGLWILFNMLAGDRASFDPYPFILLNLVLSCLAAIQAPIIMMSQKRLEERDRLRAQNDYLVNLKAELEIRHLHEKMDHLLTRQWERLAEIQEIQIELLDELQARAIPGAVQPE